MGIPSFLKRIRREEGQKKAFERGKELREAGLEEIQTTGGIEVVPKNRGETNVKDLPPKPLEPIAPLPVKLGQDFTEQRKKKGLRSQKEIEKLVNIEKAKGTSEGVARRMVASGFEGGKEILDLAQLEEKKGRAKDVLSEEGAFEEVTPQETDLSASAQFGENIPLLGPATAAIQSVLVNAVNQGWLPIFQVSESNPFPPPMTPETIREASLREISQESFQKGISSRESFGSLVESIPVVGSLARQYAAGLIETPSSNADEVIGKISKIKEAASTGQEKVRNGLERPEYGLDRAQDMEVKVAELEGRIKLLINTSPILRANADEVSKIQEEILIAKEKIARYRQASVFGLTAELTGTGRTIPTDEQLYFELKDLKS